MKTPHVTAVLLHDLMKHVQSVVPGSEPFASGLKAVTDTAWEILNLRGVDWSACGSRTIYALSVRTFTTTPDGVEEKYVSPVKALDEPKFTPYQVTQRRVAERSLNKFGHICTLVSEMFCDALNRDDLNGRQRLRCLKAHAAHIALTEKRIEEIKARMAGRAKAGDSRVAEFIARHGQVVLYRDKMYASRKEALAAMHADAKAVPVDHDLVVMMFEDAFPDTGIEDDKLAALESYLRSKDHRDARDLSQQLGIPEKVLTRHDQMLKQVINAERRLAALDDPLPEKLYQKLGVSKTYLNELMKGKVKNKATIRAALRERLYQLSPQRRPRGPRKAKLIA